MESLPARRVWFCEGLNFWNICLERSVDCRLEVLQTHTECRLRIMCMNCMNDFICPLSCRVSRGGSNTITSVGGK